MERKTDAAKVWGEYERGRSYKASAGLYDTYRNNENFYIGKQWEGLTAPDLSKPVINVLKRVVSYFIAMIVSDDIGVSFTPFDGTEGSFMMADILSKETEKAIERGKMKQASRLSIRNAAVDGDCCQHFYFDPDTQSVCTEVIENIDIFPGNTSSADIQKQPYLIIACYRPAGEVREAAVRYGLDKDSAESITPDNAPNPMQNDFTDNGLVTVLTRYWKEKGTVWCQVSTQTLVIREAWDTKYTLYPVSYMSWETVKNSFHGASAVTGLIANQVSINMLFSSAIYHIKTMAFPQVIYDKTKVEGKWKTGPGLAMGVNGVPNEAIATGFRVPDMSNQVLLTIDKLIENTMQFMGASDAALGNVKPDNTSAIIATQKATSMPLELQRLSYFQFVEDGIRIMLDIIHTDYGVRRVLVDRSYALPPEEAAALEAAGVTVPEEIPVEFDFSAFDAANNELNVDIGSAAYWSELNQMQTMDNLFGRQIITDPQLYLEGIPDKYVRNKDKIIESLEEQKRQAQAAQQAQLMPGPAPQGPPVPQG